MREGRIGRRERGNGSKVLLPLQSYFDRDNDRRHSRCHVGDDSDCL